MVSLYSAADIERLVSAGQRELVVEPGTILSPLARDRARELGLALRDERAAAPTSEPKHGQSPKIPLGTADAVRQAVDRALRRVGEQDVPRVTRETLSELAAGHSAVAAGPSVPVGRILEGRVAVVTGATSGIGQATAVALAESGAKVVVGTFSGDLHDARVTEALVEQVGGEAIVVNADVRSTEQVDGLCQGAVDHFGRLDIAVANAAVLRRDPLGQLSDEAWSAVLDVNLGGVVRVCRAAASAFTSAGAIVAVGSIAGGVFGWAEHAHYASAKAGILGLTSSLAAELGPRGIRVNAVLPGLIETPQSLDPVASIGAEGLAAAAGSVPLRRVGHATEIASAIRFLVSDEAAYITGQSIIVDGGISSSLSL
jgi:3-oxoacyl-[acyl-carrier protein] reductase